MRLVRRELDGRVPVLGFGGTPWTLAAYLVEGGGSKHFEHLLAWSYGDPEGLAVLLDRIADVSIAYLQGQIAAGAQALQLFDTWGGLLDLERWRAVALPPLRKIVDALKGQVPLIYYINGGAHLLPGARASCRWTCSSVDWRLPLSEVRRAIGRGSPGPPGQPRPRRPARPDPRDRAPHRGPARRGAAAAATSSTSATASCRWCRSRTPRRSWRR